MSSRRAWSQDVTCQDFVVVEFRRHRIRISQSLTIDSVTARRTGVLAGRRMDRRC